MFYGGLCLKTLSALPSDPLDALSASEWQRLAAQARADLLAHTPPATRRLLLRGRCPQLILHRMRFLLGTVPPPPGRIW